MNDDDEPDDVEIIEIYPKEFHLKVAGVSHSNPDDTPRQNIISRCRVGETVHFVRERDNPHDKYAVKICRQNGEQIGYVSVRDNGGGTNIGWAIAYRLDQKKRYKQKDEIYEVKIKRISEGPPCGVVLHVLWWQFPHWHKGT